jgi:hypothetical protein
METCIKEKTGKGTSSDMDIPKLVAFIEPSVWNKKKRRLLDENHVQRKRRRIIPDRLKEPDQVDGREILDDWAAWWDWVTGHFRRTSRLSDFRRFLEFDRARVLRRMECLEVEATMADMSVWWTNPTSAVSSLQTESFQD